LDFSESATLNILSLNFDARNLLELPPIPIRLAPPFTHLKENSVINTTNHMKKNVSLISNPVFEKKYISTKIAGINTNKVLFRCFFTGKPPLKLLHFAVVLSSNIPHDWDYYKITNISV